MLRKNIFYFVWYVFFVLVVGVFFRDASGQPDILASISNFYEPNEVTKMGDPVSFSLAALDIYRYGWLSQGNEWIIRLWPPGFVILEGMVLKIFGLGAPFILILIVINSLLMGLVLTIMRDSLLRYISPVLASILPVLPFLFPVCRLFLLQPGRIVLGEGFSISLFLLSFVLNTIAITKRSYKYVVFSGVALGLAAYFRSQFELLVIFMTLIGMLFGAYKVCGVRRLADLRLIKNDFTLKAIFVTLITAQLVMLPWRLYNVKNVGKPSWVVTEQLVFSNASRTDQELYSIGAGWLVQGGENIACKVESNYCGNSSKYGFYKAFINHPVDWIVFKLNLIPKYWFSSLNDFAGVTAAPNIAAFFYDSIIVFIILSNLLFLILIKKFAEFRMYSWELMSFYICNISVFILVHLETRYFYALKISSLFFFIILSAMVFGKRKDKTKLSYCEQ